MSKNAIDNENITKPVPDTPKPKGAHKAHQESATEEMEPEANRHRAVTAVCACKGAGMI